MLRAGPLVGLAVVPWLVFFLSGVVLPGAVERVPMAARFLVPGLASAVLYAAAVVAWRPEGSGGKVLAGPAGIVLSTATFYGVYIVLVVVASVAGVF